MKKWTFCGTICLAITLAGMLVVSTLAHAQTALEKKLYEAALKEGELVWWDQHSMKEAAIWIQEFNKKYPGIKVSYYECTQEVCAEKFLSEYKAGRAKTDIMNPEPYMPFKEIALDNSDIIKDANYPKELCTKDLKGVTTEYVAYVTAYNTNLISPQNVPKSWEDMLNPKWKGKISVEERLKTFIYGTEQWGEEWVVNYLNKLRNQNPIYSKGSTQAQTLLSAGEFPILVSCNLHRIIIMAAEGQPIGFVPTSPIVFQGIDSTLIPKTASHPNTAKLFLRWWLSPEGQALTDKVRYKGNPFPGSGSGQSKFLEKYAKGIPIFMSTEWIFEHERRLLKIYQEAIGFAK